MNVSFVLYILYFAKTHMRSSILLWWTDCGGLESIWLLFLQIKLNIVLGQFKFLKAFNFNFIGFFLFFGKQIILHIKELEVVCNHNFIIMQKVQLQLFIICRLLLNESISMGIYP